ncbi:MAG: PTS sugar transporter subunit IIA [Treponema sp.]|nr:PTS sugar transporter subunit IIA [Treponema sp.]
MEQDEIITIEEVAKYLRVSERTVYDWAQKGEIPSGKIGTIWRFKKSEIIQWVNERLSSGNISKRKNPVQYNKLIFPEQILFLNCSNKREALIALAENLALSPLVKSKKELIEEILRREELMSTAIGKGIAVPHVRLQSITGLAVSVGISQSDITDFNPLDDMPVRLLIMIAASFNQHSHYLQALSFFSNRLKENALRQSLLDAKTAEEAYGILIGENPL